MSNKNAYRLINPHIEGSINTVVNSRNAFGAGKKLYNTISTHFTNQVDDFYMTVQNVENSELSHFKIEETRGENGVVDFNLIKLDKNFDDKLEKKLIRNVEELNKQSQSGGRHRHGRSHHRSRRDDDSPSSSSSSSSSSDYYNKFNYFPIQPISHFTYFYLPYYKLYLSGISPLDSARIFMPMFGLPVNPSLEVRFDLYNF